MNWKDGKNISIIIENVGKVTAEKINGIMKVNMNQIPAQQTKYIGNGTEIAPNNRVIVVNAIGNLNIKWLTIYGRIYYTDGFNVRRPIDFCFNVSNIGIGNDSMWQSCPPQKDKDIDIEKDN